MDSMEDTKSKDSIFRKYSNFKDMTKEIATGQ